MKKDIISRIINRFVMRYGSISRIHNSDNKVFITFDDGPEPGITEFVLETLGKYGHSATFFCTGHNAELNPGLVEVIKQGGHAVGNHSYSHKHAYECSSTRYVSDILKADDILNTNYFRPPNGCLRLKAWMKLKSKFKIFYWTIASGDWKKETFDIDSCKRALMMTKPGDIVLFHFAKDFEAATRQLLPWYLNWLNEKGYKSDKL